MNTDRPAITISLVNEVGQPPWWQASFRDYDGFGPYPSDALDYLIEVIIASVLTKPETTS